MNFLKIFVLAVFTLFLLGCVQPFPKTQLLPLDQEFKITQGVTYSNNEIDMNIFVESFADSRCPPNVTCIQADEQSVNLVINTPTQKDMSIRLGEVNQKTVSFAIDSNAINLSLISIDSNSKVAFIKVTNTPPDQIFCTLDAKICPDGSAVGRVPPLCNFRPCPGE
jgi:hypothetical protein